MTLIEQVIQVDGVILKPGVSFYDFEERRTGVISRIEENAHGGHYVAYAFIDGRYWDSPRFLQASEAAAKVKKSKGRGPIYNTANISQNPDGSIRQDVIYTCDPGEFTVITTSDREPGIVELQSLHFSVTTGSNGLTINAAFAKFERDGWIETYDFGRFSWDKPASQVVLKQIQENGKKEQ